MDKNYKCKYCGTKMSEYDFKEYNGYCGKCREIIDWKNILEDIGEMKK